MKQLDNIFNLFWTIEEYLNKDLNLSKTFRNACIKYLNYDPE